VGFMGLGGLEVLLIGAIAFFVVGPKRLLEGIRGGRKIYSDLKRQRDALQSLITEAIDLEDLKEQVVIDDIKESVKTLEDDLKLDQVAEEFRKANEVVDKSIPRDWKFSRSPIKVDSEVRKSIPDLDISDGSDSGGSTVAKKAGPPEVLHGDESSTPATDVSSRDSGEVNS
jgi:Sec-independent protein translocase protein TatA